MTDAAKAIKLDELATRVIVPYCIMAIVGSLAMMIYYSPLPEIKTEEEKSDSHSGSLEKTSVVQYPNLVLGVIALFLYVGAEVIAGDTIGTYGQSEGIALSEAKYFTSFTLAAMVIGYIIGIFTIPKILSQSTALAISAVTGIVFSLIAINTSGYTSVLFIALLGLANALMWPAIWPLAINGLGKFMSTGSALLIMAIAGGALLPLAYGYLADLPDIGHRAAYWVLIPCYGFILYYSLTGHELTTGKFNRSCRTFHFITYRRLKVTPLKIIIENRFAVVTFASKTLLRCRGLNPGLTPLYYHILYQHRDDTEAELFLDHLLEYLHPPAGSKMLDLGCGKGRHAVYLNEKGFEVTGIDLSESINYTVRTDQLIFFVHDMRKLFRVNDFDYVFNLFYFLWIL